MNPQDRQRAIIAIWCIIIFCAVAAFIGNGSGWMRLVPALILIGSGILITVILLPEGAPFSSQEPPPPPSSEMWTPRELEILALIAAGYSNDEIASELVVTVSTVKTHINNLYRKLSVRSRTQAIARARALKLVS